jgi:hypothetical protein
MEEVASLFLRYQRYFEHCRKVGASRHLMAFDIAEFQQWWKAICRLPKTRDRWLMRFDGTTARLSESTGEEKAA